jgi:hypothetical protein
LKRSALVTAILSFDHRLVVRTLFGIRGRPIAAQSLVAPAQPRLAHCPQKSRADICGRALALTESASISTAA